VHVGGGVCIHFVLFGAVGVWCNWCGRWVAVIAAPTLVLSVLQANLDCKGLFDGDENTLPC
jgi:hypothetical protein